MQIPWGIRQRKGNSLDQWGYQPCRICSYPAKSLLCYLHLRPKTRLEPLEKAISEVLIPAITGHSCTQLEREILLLPVRLGGIGINNPCLDADCELSYSITVTKPLVEQTMAQSHQMPDDSLIKPLQQAVRNERLTVLQNRAKNIRGAATQKVTWNLNLAAKERFISLADCSPSSWIWFQSEIDNL